MSEFVSSSRVCVIGTGPRGIAACRALSERGIPFDCFEKLGSVAESLFGSAEAARGADGRGRRNAADGPQACAIAEALESYVSRFGFRPRIVFGRAVEYVSRRRGGRWRVHLDRGPARFYDAIFVAAGHRPRGAARTRSDRLLPDDAPFFDPEEREALCDDLPLWNHLIHPRYPNLFFLARLPTVRLTLCVSEEQSKYAAACLAGDYALPTRSQMNRERQAMRLAGREPDSDPGHCPALVADTRYAFHLRRERVRRTPLSETADRRAGEACERRSLASALRRTPVVVRS